MAAILDFFFFRFFWGEGGEGAEGPQQGPKGPGGPKGPQPSAGARRRAAVGRPNLLVYVISIIAHRANITLL